MKNWMTVLLFAALTGCTTQGQGLNDNHEVAGELESLNPLACVQAELVKPSDTAADIAAGALDCVEQSDYKKAIELFLISNAYARFDAQRVADQTAHDALNAIYSDNLSEQQGITLFATAWNFLPADFARFEEVCSFLRSASPPDYYPRYMIAHGQQALNSRGDKALIEDFNASQAWMRSLESLGCDLLPIEL